jgi:hypothetical protein
MEMIYIMLYKEESKGLVDPRGYIQDGPRAVTWHVAKLKETAQVAPLPIDYYRTLSTYKKGLAAR